MYEWWWEFAEVNNLANEMLWNMFWIMIDLLLPLIFIPFIILVLKITIIFMNGKIPVFIQETKKEVKKINPMQEAINDTKKIMEHTEEIKKIKKKNKKSFFDTILQK